MKKFLEIETAERKPRKIKVDCSDEACLPFGFKHGEIVVRPDGLEAKIMGVATGNDGEKVLWYVIDHPRTEGKACYWGGAKNLLEAGFKNKVS